jgi:hypothetical protein
MRKGSMPATNAKASGEVQIRSLIEAWIKAIRAKDVEGATGSISEEIVLFDVLPPAIYRIRRPEKAGHNVVFVVRWLDRLRNSRPGDSGGERYSVQLRPQPRQCHDNGRKKA